MELAVAGHIRVMTCVGRVALAMCLLAAEGCAEVRVDGAVGDGGPGGAGGGIGISFSDGGLMRSSTCGDGVLAPDETCDDGNTLDGDGCIANCLGVEPGFSCVPAGEMCRRIARCGDGVIVPPELCDDGNVVAGDGCSPTCKVELGSKCGGSPSTCTPTVCGDGKIEGAESCDDGNTIGFDGCSSRCQTEPNCKTGACVSGCGDGIVLEEECDDGNKIAGDGCDPACKREPGYDCKQPPLGENMMVPIVYRDFKARLPAEFEPANPPNTAMATRGLVRPTLDAEGKPVWSGVAQAGLTNGTNFAQWFRNVPNINQSVTSSLTLWNNGKGGYVNRYGAKGEQWTSMVTVNCGGTGAELNNQPCTNRYAQTQCTQLMNMGLTLARCEIMNNVYMATFSGGMFDGNPLFFPVDDSTFTPKSEFSWAQIPPGYSGTMNYVDEPGRPPHNFHFTSEVRYWFKYSAAATYSLTFLGDDDVWVFINGRLAVDLGGIHGPVEGTVTLDPTTANTYGLSDGKVYEVVVFHAERHVTGSSYKLTLSGFSLAPSECRPVCGDGIVGIGEECDDKVNAGGYGKCGAECKLDGFCGDGVRQPEFESCDDGVKNGIECPSGCRVITVN